MKVKVGQLYYRDYEDEKMHIVEIKSIEGENTTIECSCEPLKNESFKTETIESLKDNWKLTTLEEIALLKLKL